MLSPTELSLPYKPCFDLALSSEQSAMQVTNSEIIIHINYALKRFNFLDGNNYWTKYIMATVSCG